MELSEEQRGIHGSCRILLGTCINAKMPVCARGFFSCITSKNTRFSQSSSVRRHLSSDSGIDGELAREQLPLPAPRQVAPPVVRCLSLITCPALQAVRCLHFSPAGQHLLLAGQDLQGRLQLFVRGGTRGTASGKG